MKKILYLLLLIPALSFGQVYTFQYTGNAYYHNQYRGGVGADITLKVPVTDASTVFGFDMSGLVRLNNTLGAMQYHNGTSWNSIVDVAYGSTAYKPFSYTPSWSDVSGKPTFSTVATSGSYNDLINKPTIPSYTAGTGISLASGVFTNTAPDQTVSVTGTNGITASGTYPNFTITKKRQETYSGTTIAAGTYTVTFATAYSVAPNIQANIINGTDSQNIRTTSITTTGFTVLVRNRVDVVGLLPSWNNVSGATVDVLITEK